VIFETLSESAENGELLLVYGGMCHFHVRRDGVLTIREILVLPEQRGKRVGTYLLLQLRRIATEKGATAIAAKCPADLEANGWYQKRGFEKVGTETAKSGREINVWRLALQNSSSAAAGTRASLGLPMTPDISTGAASQTTPPLPASKSTSATRSGSGQIGMPI
jgi:hypothetical protein